MSSSVNCGGKYKFLKFLIYISHIVIDHGVSNVEITLEEGLQDIPPLVGEIQERLQSKQYSDVVELR